MKKIFRNISFALIVGSIVLKMPNVYGDVFELQQDAGPLGIVNVTVNNADDFLSFIHINNKSLPIESIDPWNGQAHNEWQMLGYAVFLPEGNESPQKVYVAKKRKYDNDESTPITDYKNIEDFRNSTNFDHTERQLLSRILKDYNIISETNGVICIYTESAPCRNNASDNCNYPCIAYYQKLVEAFPNVKFRIFFYEFSNIPTKSDAKKLY